MKREDIDFHYSIPEDMLQHMLWTAFWRGAAGLKNGLYVLGDESGFASPEDESSGHEAFRAYWQQIDSILKMWRDNVDIPGGGE